MTNLDVINRLSPADLADFLSRWGDGDIDFAKTFCDLCENGDCNECRRWWLTEIDAETHPQGLQHFENFAYKLTELPTDIIGKTVYRFKSCRHPNGEDANFFPETLRVVKMVSKYISIVEAIGVKSDIPKLGKTTFKTIKDAEEFLRQIKENK